MDTSTDSPQNQQPQTQTPPLPAVPLNPQPTGTLPPSTQPKPAAPQGTENATAPYQSNPFLATTDGLVTILKLNAGPAIAVNLVVILLAILGFIVSIILSALHAQAISIGLSILTYVIFLPLLMGANLATASASIAGQKLNLKQVLSKGAAKIIPLILLGLMLVPLIAVGFLLLIIPGFILLARTSLAGIVMFEENLGPVAAIKRSMQLTKGHVMEMLGATFAGGLLSGNGLLSPAIQISPLVGRYTGLVGLQKSGAAKPKVHWANYLGLILVVLIIAATAAGAIIISRATKNTEKNLTPSYTSPYDTFPSATSPDVSYPSSNCNYKFDANNKLVCE